MITLRMLWIAVALVVALPMGVGLADHAIGHTTVPGGDIVNAGLEEAAHVEDIVLLDPLVTYDKVFVFEGTEQLVEGHTVFVTLDTLLVPNITNWSANIIGDIKCETHADFEGYYFLGVPVPHRINEAHEECHAAGMVFVTPDPFYDSNDTYGGTWHLTGIEYPFTAPNGQSSAAREYEYSVVRTDPLTFAQTQSTWYAWEVPILQEWKHTDGSTKRWYCPIPVSRIDEMGVSHFTGWVGDSPPDMDIMR